MRKTLYNARMSLLPTERFLGAGAGSSFGSASPPRSRRCASAPRMRSLNAAASELPDGCRAVLEQLLRFSLYDDAVPLALAFEGTTSPPPVRCAAGG